MHEQLRIARYFNSRPSARGDPCCVGCLQGHNDFNSRPSARGDIDIPEHDVKAGISIHAPPRGATAAASTMAGLSSYFNSRPSARGDAHPHSCIRTARIFQFTPLREGRQANCLDYAPDVIFQFTPLREGRPGKLRQLTTRMTYFNSRPSARGDRRGEALAASRAISIHAPPRGATNDYGRSIPHGDFNSRPSARGDASAAPRQPPRRISIHAPPRGATKPVDHAPHYEHDFNSRPSARGDLSRLRRNARSTNFNSRPSARGDLYYIW